MLKVIVAGSRSFNSYALLKDSLLYLLSEDDEQDKPSADIEIVSGGAKGADTLGRMFANEFGLKIKFFYPDWDKHGRAAGPLRNKEMSEYADALVAFWDGESRGTKNMIELMKKAGKPCRVVMVNEDKQ